MTEKPGGFTR